MTINISVLIINYNTAELVKACIESVLKQRDINFEIIVVDNQSRDASLAVLQQFGAQIQLIANNQNLGFGKANNQAFAKSQGEYLFLLNPDAVLLTDLDLYHAVQYMQTHAEYGLIGTRIIDSANQLTVSASYHYPRQKQTQADFSHLPGEWATVLGASMVIRRDVFANIGGFDEQFFLYAEETDLCLRIRQAGYAIGYCEAVTVQHIGGASEKSNPPAEVIAKKKSGKYLFYRKHYPTADVIKLVKKDLWYARWHLVRLSLRKWLFGLNKKQAAKWVRHQVSCQTAKEFLSKSVGATGGRPA